MGIVSEITSVFRLRDLRPAGKPEVGITKGNKPGDIGVWAVWSAEKHPTEAFRLIVKPFSRDHVPSVPEFSYTFAPSHERSFLVSIETPLEFREFLRGRNRAREGHVTFELIFGTDRATHVTFDLETVLACYQSRGPEPRPLAEPVPGTFTKDTAAVAALKPSQLKQYSEEAKRRLEEKRLKEEAEKKAREEAARIAAEKAAEAAKAAALKAADAKKPAAAKPGAGAESAPATTISGGKVGLFYGTTTGNTGTIAEMIKTELGASVDHIKGVTDMTPLDFTVPEILILGVPTWHIGEMQDDWAAILPEVANQNYQGKKVAIFGLGDGKGYPDTYVDAMQELWEKFEAKGAKLVGLWPTEGYEFQKSKAIKDGKFLGLVVDIENQHHLTDDRVKRWCTQIRKELGL